MTVMTDTTEDLAGFLDTVEKTGEAGLFMGSTADLAAHGWQALPGAKALGMPGRYYLEASAANMKDAHDLALQYASGQIDAFDKEAGTHSFVEPRGALVFAASADALQAGMEAGYDLREVIGPAWSPLDI